MLDCAPWIPANFRIGIGSLLFAVHLQSERVMYNGRNQKTIFVRDLLQIQVMLQQRRPYNLICATFAFANVSVRTLAMFLFGGASGPSYTNRWHFKVGVNTTYKGDLLSHFLFELSKVLFETKCTWHRLCGWWWPRYFVPEVRVNPSIGVILNPKIR